MKGCNVYRMLTEGDILFFEQKKANTLLWHERKTIESYVEQMKANSVLEQKEDITVLEQKEDITVLEHKEDITVL